MPISLKFTEGDLKFAVPGPDFSYSNASRSGLEKWSTLRIPHIAFGARGSNHS